MKHLYKANAGAILKVGVIPMEIKESVVFTCETDLLAIAQDIELDLPFFQEWIKDEWINLTVLNERKLKNI